MDHEPTGICDHCGARFASMARFECRTCKNHNVSSPKALAVFHPTVTAFYDKHGISTRIHAEDVKSVQRVFDLMDAHEVDVVAENPPRADVTVISSGDEMRLVFDETASVAEVHR